MVVYTRKYHKYDNMTVQHQIICLASYHFQRSFPSCVFTAAYTIHICSYVYNYVYMYACVYVATYVCMHIIICTNLYVCIFTYVYTRGYIHAYAWLYLLDCKPFCKLLYQAYKVRNGSMP